MNPIQLNELGGKPSVRDAGSRPADTTGEASTAQDHLWQQAMRQAQQQGFAGWFAGPSAGGIKAAEAARPLPDPPPSGTHAEMTGSRREPDHATALSRLSVARGHPGVSLREASTAKAPLAARFFVGPLESRPEVRTAPVALDAGVEFATALTGAFARFGVSVSTGSQPGGFSEQTAVRTTDNAVPPRAESAASIRALSNDEGDVESTEADPLPPAQSSATATPTPVRPSDPLRVHAEWSNAGVRVWLGAEASALDAAHALAGRLQDWLGSRGERLLSLVCNGRPLSTSRERALMPQTHGIESDALPIVTSSSSQEAS